MTRDDLSALLDQDTTACRLARAALLAGGSFEIYDGPAPANRHAGVYGIRLRRMQRRSRMTLALDEAVDILRCAGDQPVRVGLIMPADRTWTFMLFLNATATAVLACAGVERTTVND
ncbi:hypothetical protein G3I60_28915 [Streptomyces sp. SID13666]|uniref:hypothetical protein n=1 Tax=unclassified Streptomyces TaxID=2593676 RepID=UPI0013C007D9|nr:MULTISPECIES: hypothetical protein [unclassified Streptomyces]NEA58071.1 hypothetical protein [Streptomyces sp. SID13666]NEA74075.1 hypothetical protein [Streptomyces sp. SID13588]